MRPAGMPCRSDLYNTVQEPACIVFSVHSVFMRCCGFIGLPHGSFNSRVQGRMLGRITATLAMSLGVLA